MAGLKIGAVDVHVGRRLRAARIAKSLSQDALARAIGIRGQQIQKYENGTNRIGTGRLHALATLLQVPVTYFFEGIDTHAPKGGKDRSLDALAEALSTKEGVRIAAALSRIHDPTTRRRIADLLEAMITDERAGVQSLADV